MKTSAEWDAIVVGGGPAGSTTAALLAARRHSVLIVDRCRFPRPKPCGESLNPGAVEQLRALGLLEQVERLPHRPITGWRLHPISGRAFSGSFGGDTAGIAVDRAIFDHLLVDHAQQQGAVLLEGTTISDIRRPEEGLPLLVDRDGGVHRGRIIIGADGLRSVVVRRSGLRARAPRLRKLALTAHVVGLPQASAGDLYLRPWGCVGTISVDEEQSNVVIVVNRPPEDRPARDAGDWFDMLLSSVPALSGARRAGAARATGPFDVPVRSIAADGVMLVGDAAGYFDPFTGQGIYRAIRGGRMAAEAAHEALSSPERRTDAMRAYAAGHNRAFGSGVRLQHLIEGVTARPQLFSAASAVLRAVPPLADYLVRLAGDVTSPDRSSATPS